MEKQSGGRLDAGRRQTGADGFPVGRQRELDIRSQQNRQRQGMGGSGVSLGIPGIGMGRRRGGPPGGQPPPNQTPDGDPPVLQVRWESRCPFARAELKGREVNAPDIDQASYAIAVYGVPARMASGDEKTLAAQFKKQAVIKREGQKDLKPSSVQVLQREDGPVIVYLFPRKVEIKRSDRRVEFDAQIARRQFMKAFYVEYMVWQGKLDREPLAGGIPPEPQRFSAVSAALWKLPKAAPARMPRENPQLRRAKRADTALAPGPNSHSP